MDLWACERGKEEVNINNDNDNYKNNNDENSKKLYYAF